MALTAKVLTGTLENDASPGYTDFTSSGFGTPDAALVFVSNSSITANPNTTFGISVGFWDGTSQYCNSIGANDSQATDNTSRSRKTDAIASAIGGGEALYAEYTISNITDGVRITLSYDNTGVERYATVVLIKGVTAKKVGSITQDNTTSAQDITSIGFKPDLVFFAGSNRTGVDESGHALLFFGVAHNDSSDTVTQGAVSFFYGDATSVESIVNNSVSDDCAERVYWNDGAILDRKTVISAFDADGFTITASEATPAFLEYLALELPDPDDAYVAIKDSKTSTGTQAYTGTGFTPILLGLFGNTDTATNSTSANPTGSMSYGWADATTEQCLITGAEDAVGTSNCYSRTDTSNILNLRFDDDTVDAVAALDSFDSDGWTLNYSDGSASARKMLAIAIGNSSTGGTNYTLTAEAGSFTLTGSAATLTRQITPLTASAGSFTLTGVAAGLLAARKLTAETGSFALTGIDATLVGAHTLPAEAASFDLTGYDASFALTRVLAAAKGTFTLEGHDATLTKAGAGSYTLTAATGSFVLSPNDAGLYAARTLTATATSFTLTGVAANLLKGFALAAAVGDFTLAGNAATFSRSYTLYCTTGTFTLTGTDTGLAWSGSSGYTITCDAGTFTLTGVAAGLRAARYMNAVPVAFYLTGYYAKYPTSAGDWTQISADYSSWSDVADSSNTWVDVQ